VKLTKNQTTKQRQRQAYRTNGRYSLVNPCYACGKSAGVEYSCHPLTDTGDWNDTAICLCHKCWQATYQMTEVAEFLKYKEQFGDASKLAWLKVRGSNDDY